MTIEGQLTIFDVLTEAPAIMEGDPGTFLHPGDFEAMHDQKNAWHDEYNVHNHNWRPYRGWTPNSINGKDSAHVAQSFDADLRCQHYWRTPCECVGQLVYRVYCYGCEYWTGIHGNENEAWEEHLDHCWPGWRELPILESKQVGYGYQWAFPDNYPTKFKQAGAPLKDCRGVGPLASRHVPAGNTFGGLRLAAFQPCDKHTNR